MANVTDIKFKMMACRNYAASFVDYMTAMMGWEYVRPAVELKLERYERGAYGPKSEDRDKLFDSLRTKLKEHDELEKMVRGF